MKDRQYISSGTPWEEQVGYSRAIRVGHLVFVTGTLAADEHGQVYAPGDAFEQTCYALRKIESALVEAGSCLKDVVRTRIYITDMAYADEVGRAHKELLGDIRPATTMVCVSGLWGEGSVVEIEVDSVIS